MKRFVSLILSVCFLFSINTVSYAANISSRKASNPVIQSMNDKYHVDFSGMSIDELNKFIDKMKDEDQTRASGNLLNNTQLAWLAAAQIARDKGYECAALMVEFSVYNIDYSESVTDSSTPLLDKLNTTTVFNNYKNKVLNSGLKDFSGGSWSFTIQKSDNADLFYALHRVSTSGTGFMIGNSIMYYLITVHDTFDFAWLGLHWQSSNYSSSQLVYAYGYPSQINGADARYRMCKSSGYIRSQTSKYLKGDWDLTGGFSGGPLVEYISGAGYVAIGIHKDGSTIDGSSYPTSYTGALRITQSLYTLFLSYRG